MAKGRKLKVYRMPVGFHDAYVAAPSQKAAIEAWGADGNPFARGEAEEVTEPELTKRPLETPGAVIKVLRGTEREQIAALDKVPSPGATRRPAASKKTDAKPGTKTKPRPRPSRQALEKAEQALASAEDKHRAAIDKLRAEEDALADRRRKLEAEQSREREQLEDKLAQERERYRRAMAQWAED